MGFELKILTKIASISKDKTKSIEKDALTYVANKNILTDWERKFYTNTVSKRKLSLSRNIIGRNKCQSI